MREPPVRRANGSLEADPFLNLLGENAPIHEEYAHPSCEQGQQEYGAHLPDQHHYARILRMKKTQSEISQSGRSQTAERGRQMGIQRGAATKHNCHRYCRDHTDEDDCGKTEPVRMK